MPRRITSLAGVGILARWTSHLSAMPLGFEGRISTEAAMPLTAKGQKILAAMKKTYGAKKGKAVYYASQNAGKITGTHKT